MAMASTGAPGKNEPGSGAVGLQVGITAQLLSSPDSCQSGSTRPTVESSLQRSVVASTPSSEVRASTSRVLTKCSRLEDESMISVTITSQNSKDG